MAQLGAAGAAAEARGRYLITREPVLQWQSVAAARRQHVGVQLCAVLQLSLAGCRACIGRGNSMACLRHLPAYIIGSC